MAYCFGRWHIVVPEELPGEVDVSEEGGSTESSTVGIDPGLRTAFTCASNTGDVIEFCVGTDTLMEKINSKRKGLWT